MIYFFHGSDVEKVRTKAFAWVAAAREKEANLAYLRLTGEELTPATLEHITLSGGLFIKRLLVLVDDPFVKKEDTVVLEDALGSLATSDNAIVLLAPNLHATKAKKIADKATKTYTFDAVAAHKPTRGFNTALVNAFSARNKEKLWVEINKALRAGDAPEVIHGLLHWKARDILAKGNRSWTFAEARELSMNLIEVLQASRRGGLTLSKGLERFALAI